MPPARHATPTFLNLNISGDFTPKPDRATEQRDLQRTREQLRSLLSSSSSHDANLSPSDGLAPASSCGNAAEACPGTSHTSCSTTTNGGGGGSGGVWGSVIRASSASRSRGGSAATDRPNPTRGEMGSKLPSSQPSSPSADRAAAVPPPLEEEKAEGPADDKRGGRRSRRRIPSFRRPTTASLTRSILVEEEQAMRRERRERRQLLASRARAEAEQREAAHTRGRRAARCFPTWQWAGSQAPTPRTHSALHASSSSPASESRTTPPPSHTPRSRVADDDDEIEVCWRELQNVEDALEYVEREAAALNRSSPPPVVRELRQLREELLATLDEALQAKEDTEGRRGQADDPPPPPRSVRIASSLSTYRTTPTSPSPRPSTPRTGRGGPWGPYTPSPAKRTRHASSPLPITKPQPQPQPQPRRSRSLVVRMNRAQVKRQEANMRSMEKRNTAGERLWEADLNAERLAALYLDQRERHTRGGDMADASQTSSPRQRGTRESGWAAGPVPIPPQASFSSLHAPRQRPDGLHQRYDSPSQRYRGWLPHHAAEEDREQRGSGGGGGGASGNPVAAAGPRKRVQWQGTASAVDQLFSPAQHTTTIQQLQYPSPHKHDPSPPHSRLQHVRRWEAVSPSPMLPERGSFLEDGDEDEDEDEDDGGDGITHPAEAAQRQRRTYLWGGAELSPRRARVFPTSPSSAQPQRGSAGAALAPIPQQLQPHPRQQQRGDVSWSHDGASSHHSVSRSRRASPPQRLTLRDIAGGTATKEPRASQEYPSGANTSSSSSLFYFGPPSSCPAWDVPAFSEQNTGTRYTSETREGRRSGAGSRISNDSGSGICSLRQIAAEVSLLEQSQGKHT